MTSAQQNYTLPNPQIQILTLQYLLVPNQTSNPSKTPQNPLENPHPRVWVFLYREYYPSVILYVHSYLMYFSRRDTHPVNPPDHSIVWLLDTSSTRGSYRNPLLYFPCNISS